MRLSDFKLKHFNITLPFFCLLFSTNVAIADIVANLELLRNRCLYYAIGHAPNDINTKTIRNGLYAQSPFSPTGEVDIAASGFSLAALPIAVRNGLVSYADANAIASSSGAKIKQLIENSEAATTTEEISKFGYRGMLYHYYTWSEIDNAFLGNVETEISSVDTTLLLFGFLVSAQYFQGQVMSDFKASINRIHWNEWIDGIKNQFHMSYTAQEGFSGLWDVRTDETILICLLAAMCDPSLNIKSLWNAWKKESVTYVSLVSPSRTFTCYATWNGDPFTVFYGYIFLKYSYDFNGIDWYTQSQIAYQGHVEFFKTERGYLNSMVLAFTDNSQGVIAKPKLSPDEPITKNVAPIYGIAGGLEFYSNDPESNEIARTLSSLVQKQNDNNDNNNNFFSWTGWPCESVIATNINHPRYSDSIIGQNVSAIAISIDNYLTGGWMRDLIMEYNQFKPAFYKFFPLLGDINYDNEVDLQDAIISLRVITGHKSSYIINSKTEEDVNREYSIGLEEAIYILKKLSNVR